MNVEKPAGSSGRAKIYNPTNISEIVGEGHLTPNSKLSGILLDKAHVAQAEWKSIPTAMHVVRLEAVLATVVDDAVEEIALPAAGGSGFGACSAGSSAAAFYTTEHSVHNQYGG